MMKRLEEETVATVTTSIDEGSLAPPFLLQLKLMTILSAAVTPNVTAIATKAAADVDLYKRNIDFKSKAGAAPLDSYSHPHDRAALSANVKDVR
jgi:hypothetical protein